MIDDMDEKKKFDLLSYTMERNDAADRKASADQIDGVLSSVGNSTVKSIFQLAMAAADKRGDITQAAIGFLATSFMGAVSLCKLIPSPAPAARAAAPSASAIVATPRRDC